MNKKQIVLVAVLIALSCLIIGYLLASWIATPSVKAPKPHTTVSKPKPPDVEEIVKLIDEQRLMKHIQELADNIGVRQSGTTTEEDAAQYIADTLQSCGYKVEMEKVDVEGKFTTQNVVASQLNQTGRAMLIGAHIDTKKPSPGANDNASGVAVMLELAYLLKDINLATPCIFAGFGAEEMIDKNKEHHHYGARALAGNKEFRAGISSMTSIDMVGVGKTLYLETRGRNTDWRDNLAEIAYKQGYPVMTGAGKPWSDHEAFEKYGVPVAYVHWEKDTHYHKITDTSDRIDPILLVNTTELMLRAIIPKVNNGGSIDNSRLNE